MQTYVGSATADQNHNWRAAAQVVRAGVAAMCGGMIRLVTLCAIALVFAACSDSPLEPALQPDAPAEALLVDEVVSNLRAASGRSYRVDDMIVNGARVYVDRDYTYANLPDQVRRHLAILTGNSDQKVAGNGNFLSFRLNQPAEVFVASHGSTPQRWIANRGFKPTGQKLLVVKNGERNEYTIYSRAYSAGTVSLGSNRDGNGAAQMYTVFIKPSGGSAKQVANEDRAEVGGFEQVVAGIRPRGYGKTSYSRSAPIDGGTTYYVATNGSDNNRGTSSAPFRTINKAAQVAQAGDVVTIREGTYRESVYVKNRGTASKPIVFQAASRGSVVLTGGSHQFVPANWTGGVKQNGSTHVTLRGLIFRNYASTENSNARYKAAVGAIRGWKIEDCLFDRAGYSGLDIRGDSVEVTRSTFQYHHTLAIAANGTNSEPPLRGIRITDIVLRGNNTRSDPLAGKTSTKVVKFWLTDHAVIDNIESYENNGPGWWFDTENTNWVVRNSYLHDNVGDSGRGLYLEKNFAPGRVENNVFARNEVGGLVVRNSQGVTVTGNLFVGDGKSLWLVAAGAGSKYPLKNVTIEGNYFKGWNNPASIHAAGEEITNASRMNIVADNNVYEPGKRSELSFWNNTGMIRSIEEMRSRLGWERNGRVGSIPSPF